MTASGCGLRILWYSPVRFRFLDYKLTLRWDTCWPGMDGILPLPPPYKIIFAVEVWSWNLYQLSTLIIEVCCQKISSVDLAAFLDLGETKYFLRKINVTIEFYAQKLTYIQITMDFGQLSFFTLFCVRERPRRVTPTSTDSPLRPLLRIVWR